MTSNPTGVPPAGSVRPGRVLVVGAGPGVGLAVARRFSRPGGAVGLIARDPDRLDALRQTLEHDGRTVGTAVADVTDSPALHAAVARVFDQIGSVDTVCFSPLPPMATIKPVLDTRPDDVMAALALSVGGAVATVRAVLPAMLDRQGGRLLFTAGSAGSRPSPDRAAAAVYTAAETAYLDVLRRALDGTGVAVVHLAISGAVGPGGRSPAEVADALWSLAQTGSARAILE